MKFIREMITKKNRSPEMDPPLEEDDFEFEVETRDDSDQPAPASMPSIQARLQSALEKAEAKGERKERGDNGRRPVEDFRDVVGSRSRPQPQDTELTVNIDDLDLDDEIDLDELNELAESANLEVDVADPSPEESLDLEIMNGLGVSSEEPQSSEGHFADAAQGAPETSIQPEPSKVVTPFSQRAATPSSQEAERPQLSTETIGSFAADKTDNEAPEEAEADLSTDAKTDTNAFLSEVATTPSPIPQMVEVPAPAAGRSGRRAGRVKTRLLGFENAHGAESDPFDATRENAATPQGKFPVGWIVVLQGPGRGSSFGLSNGVSQIGRGDDQAVRLDFGDSSISRSNHAAIAYDSEQRTFFIGHGGKANLVRLNNKPVLSTEEIADGDLIRIGETILRFVGLCGPDFDWETGDDENVSDAAIA